jgi:hypothetical protein
MKENMDIRGNVAYMAMKEDDPDIWNSYVESLPEELRRAMPEYSPTAMKVTAAQSAEIMDAMNKLENIKAQGEKQKDVAGYQGSVSAGLEDRKHENAMARQQEKYNLDRKLGTNKMVNELTIESVKGQGGGSNKDEVKTALEVKKNPIAYSPEANAAADAIINQSMGVQPQAQQAPTARYKYVAGQGLVPITE